MSISITVCGSSVDVKRKTMKIHSADHVEIIVKDGRKKKSPISQVGTFAKKLLNKVKVVESKLDKLNCGLKSPKETKSEREQYKKLNDFECKYHYLKEVYKYIIDDEKKSKRRDTKIQSDKNHRKVHTSDVKPKTNNLVQAVEELEKECHSFLSLTDKYDCKNKHEYSVEKCIYPQANYTTCVSKIQPSESLISKKQKGTKNIKDHHLDKHEITEILSKIDKVEKLLKTEHKTEKCRDDVDVILKTLHVKRSSLPSRRYSKKTDENNENPEGCTTNNNLSNLLAGIPKYQPRIFKGTSSFYGKKPPSVIITRRLNLDTPIHELSTIDETFFSVDKSRTSTTKNTRATDYY